MPVPVNPISCSEIRELWHNLFFDRLQGVIK